MTGGYYNIETILVVIASNIHNPLDSKILLIKQEDVYSLPREFLTNAHTTEQSAAYLLHKYTNIKPGAWAKLHQSKAVDDTDRVEEGYRCVAIPYVVFLPEIVGPLINAEWVKILDLKNVQIYKDHLDIIEKIGKGNYVAV